MLYYTHSAQHIIHNNDRRTVFMTYIMICPTCFTLRMHVCMHVPGMMYWPSYVYEYTYEYKMVMYDSYGTENTFFCKVLLWVLYSSSFFKNTQAAIIKTLHTYLHTPSARAGCSAGRQRRTRETETTLPSSQHPPTPRRKDRERGTACET